MPKLFLPYHLKKETNNEDYVEVEGSTLREVIENLEKMYPGTKDYLVEGNRIKPGYQLFVVMLQQEKVYYKN